MQFGKIHGVALAILGLMLLAFQASLFLKADQPANTSSSTVPIKVEHRTNPVAGILGILALGLGVAIVVTGKRHDEPEPQHAVK